MDLDFIRGIMLLLRWFILRERKRGGAIGRMVVVVLCCVCLFFFVVWGVLLAVLFRGLFCFFGAFPFSVIPSAWPLVWDCITR